jgi:hypothetical protein
VDVLSRSYIIIYASIFPRIGQTWSVSPPYFRRLNHFTSKECLLSAVDCFLEGARSAGCSVAIGF